MAFKTGLLSNHYSDLRHYMENVWKIADLFAEIVISAEVGRLNLHDLNIPGNITGFQVQPAHLSRDNDFCKEIRNLPDVFHIMPQVGIMIAQQTCFKPLFSDRI